MSVLTLNFRKMLMATNQIDNQEVPIIIQATYLFKNNSKYPESQSKTFIIGREVNRKNPFMNQKMDMKLKGICFEEANESMSHQVEVIQCKKELAMYFELFKLIGRLNPDVIEGYQLDGNIYQILKRILTEGHIPMSVFLADVLIPASRFRPSLTQERVLNKNGDATRITH